MKVPFVLAGLLLSTTACTSDNSTDDSAGASTGDSSSDSATAVPSDTSPPDDSAPRFDTSGETGQDTGTCLDSGLITHVPPDYRATDPARVVFMGDSITAGAGASSSQTCYRSLLLENDSTSWPGWDQADLESLFPALSEVIDVSRGGATTTTLAQVQLADLDQQLEPTVEGETIVVVTIGGNDLTGAMLTLLTSDDPDAQAQALLDEMNGNLSTLSTFFDDSQRFPDGVYVYLANIYDPTDDTAQASECFFGIDLVDIWPYLYQANDAFLEFAMGAGYAMIDMHGHFLGHGWNYDDPDSPCYDASDPSVWFSGDCIHPNDDGHHEIRRLFFGAIDGTAELPDPS